MANTSAVYARIDTNLKDNAESILSQLGISPSSAIQMLYSQIVLKKGMPFELKLPSSKPLAVGAMTREQLDAELHKGVDSIKAGKVYSAEIAAAELEKVKEKYTVTGILTTGGMANIKIIADEKPFPHARQIQPDVEDAYMYLMSGK